MRALVIHTIFSIFLLICGAYSHAQNQQKIDSMLRVLKSQKDDTNKVKTFIAVSKQFKRNLPDSCIYYSTKGLLLSHKLNYIQGIANCYNSLGYSHSKLGNYKDAISNFNKSIEYAIKINDKQGLAASYNNLGLVKEKQSEYKEAVYYFNKTLEIDMELNDSSSIAGDYNNIGMIFWSQGDFSKSLEYYLKSLKIKEKIGNKESIAYSYLNIGLLLKDMLDYKQALKYYYNALEIFKIIEDKSGIATCYHNIAGVELMKNMYPEAKNNYLKALNYYLELEELTSIAFCYHNLGNLAYYEKKYSEANEYYHRSLKIFEKIEDKKDIAICLSNISSIYAINGKYTDAINTAKKALKISKEIGALPTELDCYQHLSNAYESLGDYKNAYINHRSFKEINDSIYNQESSEQVKQMEAKYQSEKKQLEIDNLNKDKVLKELELTNKKEVYQKQKYLIYSIVLGLFVILIFSFLTFRQFLQKQRANKLLRIQQLEIQQKNEEISAQRDEIESQRDIVIKQKDKIEVIHEKATSSIRYAKKIQTAVLPGYDITEMFLPDHFILFKPRDIVSGDFYWTMIKKNWLYVAVADCTGHGVPGAFMSMLGISFLNEIIAHNEYSTASHILDDLRTQIIVSLKQKGQIELMDSSTVTHNVNDGMDISLIAINLEDYNMHFAGANNPCWIIHSTTDTREPLLTELKADKMPIAIYPDMVPFTNNEIQLHNGNCIYLFTDGFADQFGGKDGKKFMRKRLKEMILENHKETMELQCVKYDEIIGRWMNNNGKIYNQTDDITLFGMRINL